MDDKLKQNMSDLEIITELSRKGYDMRTISAEIVKKNLKMD